MLMQKLFDNAIKALKTLNPEIIKVIQNSNSIIYHATNTENSLKLTIPIWTEVTGEFYLPFKILEKSPVKIATKILKTKVEFNELIVKASLPEDFYNFPKLVKRYAETEILNFKKFIETGKTMLPFIDIYSTHESIKGICLSNDYICATNGNILLKTEYALGLPQKEQIIISHQLIKTLTSSFINNSYTYLNIYKNTDSITYTKISGDTFEFISKNIPEHYPVIEKLLPKNFTGTLKVSIDHLLTVIKTILPFSPDKTSLISFKISNSELIINTICREKNTEYSTSIPVIAEGKFPNVSVNASMLKTVLETANTDELEIKFENNPLSAITILPKNSNQYLLIMPLKNTDN